MGIFDDIFDDDDFEIKDEELVDDSPDPGHPDTWGTPPDGNWDTGKQQDLWNTDEPWTCDDDGPHDDCGPCADCETEQGDDDTISDWF